MSRTDEVWTELQAAVDEIEKLRQQRDEARTEFDGLGPLIEKLEKANTHIRTDNKRLFDNWRKEQALVKECLQRAEAAEAEAAALKKLEAAHRGEEARQAADLHERLATAEDETTRLCKELTIASSLVPSADWLLMVAAIADDLGCDACPYLGNCENHCDRISDKARARAARIRAWRGDGDKEGGEDGN